MSSNLAPSEYSNALSHKNAAFLRKAIICTAIIAALSGVFVFWAEREIFSHMGDVFRKEIISFGVVAVLLLLSICNYAFRAERWRVFVRTSAKKYGFFSAIRHYIAGFAFVLTPGKAGELVRLGFLKRDLNISFAKGAAFTVADRFFDFFALSALLAPGLIALPQWRIYAIGPALICFMLMFVFLRPAFFRAPLKALYGRLGFGKKTFASLLRVLRTFGMFSRYDLFFKALSLSIIGWFCEAFAFYYLLDCLGAGIGLSVAVFIFAASALAGAMLLTPGGTGGAEATIAGLLILQGVETETALIATVIIRLATLWFAVALGICVAPFELRKK